MNENEITSKEKILNAALEEFSEKGYKLSSTNSIVLRAGLSKGLIFHYFGSKKNLYVECLKIAIETFMIEEKILDFTAERDYFERLRQFVTFKINFAYSHKLFIKLVADAYEIYKKGDMPEIGALIEESAKYQWNKLITDVDTSHFKKIIPVEMILKYIQVAVESHALQYTSRYKDDYYKALENIDIYFNELKVFSDLIKYGAYEVNSN